MLMCCFMRACHDTGARAHAPDALPEGWVLTRLPSGRGFLAKVADFGHARVLDLTTRITTRSYGTLTHMPPEVTKPALSPCNRQADTMFGLLMPAPSSVAVVQCPTAGTTVSDHHASPSALQVLVHGQISTKCDVYSFGVLLWQMFAGSRPWSGERGRHIREVVRCCHAHHAVPGIS
jgi:serine/threonine protein kinase